MIADPSEFTVVIRGPLLPHAVATLRRYAPLGVRFVISFWDGADGALVDSVRRIAGELGLSIEHERRELTLRRQPTGGIAWDASSLTAREPDVRLIAIGPAGLAADLAARPPYSYVGSGYAQMVCALIGLERVATPRCIVMRSDEFFWDPSQIIERCRTTSKLVTSNLMFFSDRYRKFHASDHWMAGSTTEIRNMMRVAKERVEVEDVWGHDLFCAEFLAGRAESALGAYYDRGGMNFHQLLTTSLLRERGHAADSVRSRALVADNFDIIPVREFEEFAWSFATPKHRIAAFVTRLRADPAFGERHGVRPVDDSRIEFYPVRPPLARDQALALWRAISGYVVETDNVQADAIGIDDMDEL